MHRRDFMKTPDGITCRLVSLALVIVAPLVTFPAHDAVAADRLPRVGFIAFEPGGCRNAAFHKGMRELGYVEGENFAFECRHANGSFEGLDAAAVELVRAKPKDMTKRYDSGKLDPRVN